MFQDALAAAKKWVEQPFSPQMSLLQVFLLVGAVGISAVLWGRIMAQLSEDL